MLDELHNLMLHHVELCVSVLSGCSGHLRPVLLLTHKERSHLNQMKMVMKVRKPPRGERK